jgi:hypothetical protein
MLKIVIAWVIFTGMPAVDLYHRFSENPHVNAVFNTDSLWDHWANTILTPCHFLCNAKKIEPDTHSNYQISLIYDYDHHLFFKSLAAVALAPASYTLGMILKGIAYLNSNYRKTIFQYVDWLHHGEISICKSQYQLLGISDTDDAVMEMAECQGYQRKEGDKTHLYEEKEGLKAIAALLKKHRIPFWLDCGTCLGAYRYGGSIPWDNDVDLAILRPDFLNAYKALLHLDPALYHVQDWSGRDRPMSYLKVYVKKTHTLIDIYTFHIDSEAKKIHYLIGHENSIFLPDSWRERERSCTKPSLIHEVFPLKLARFEDTFLPVPRDTKKYLQLRYGENIEPVKIFNPVSQAYEKDLSHPYWQLNYAQ